MTKNMAELNRGSLGLPIEFLKEHGKVGKIYIALSGGECGNGAVF